MSESKRPIVFVLGVPRSGTTLLRVMLAGHPRLFSPPEMLLAPFQTMAERHDVLEQRYWEKGGLRRTFMELEGLDANGAKARVDGLNGKRVPEVYQLLQDLIGEDRILVDKCPHLCAAPDALRRLERWFPQAHYLWILRHPGSTIRSFQNVNLAEALAVAYGEPEELWRRGTATIREFLATVPAERWMRFQYEEMVKNPEPIMRGICAMLRLDFAPSMLAPYEGERMLTGPSGARAVGDPNTAARDRIEPELADKWLATFDHRKVSADTKALAREVGYDLESVPLPPIVRVSEAISSLLDTVKALEAGIRAPRETDDLEGRRFLLRMLSASIDTFTEYGDPDRPTWHSFIGPTRKMFGDCPDCDYLRAPIRLGSGRVYRLTGAIPENTTYLGIVLHRRGGRLGGHINHRDLKLAPDGRFELFVSKEEQPGPWLRGDGDETEIVMRQYFVDRHTERPATIHLELLEPQPAPAPLDVAAYAESLDGARKMISGVLARVRKAHETVVALPNKQFYVLPGDGLFPTPDNLYQVCWYQFGPDQAFVVHGKLPKAAFFSMCLYNAWMESLDYTRFPVNLNHGQLRTDAEGRFTVVLSESDPGVPNWLRTAGHTAGYLLARSLLLEGAPPELIGETVWLTELAERM